MIVELALVFNFTPNKIMCNMKKIVGIITIAALTSMLTFIVAKKFIYSDQVFAQNENLNNDFKLQHANYTGEAPAANPVGGYVNLEDAAEASAKAVVHIKTETKATNVRYRDPFAELFGNPFGQRQFNAPQSASGSGVVISADGFIVTNNHVVDGADEVTVTFNNKRTVNAKVVGTDPSTDLALLKVEETGLPFLNFGNSDNVRLGEWVLAVGYPLNLETTVTAGIVSAKQRNIGINQRKGGENAIESFIQTDAAVNPGNSGGALVNASGLLIGINSAIASPTGSYAGYSYAIPANLVKKVVDDMRQFGNVQRAYLGINFVDSKTQDPETRKQFNLDNINGIYINNVIEGSSAENAGIQKGDILVSIGEKKINTGAQLQENVARLRPGDKINVTLERNGRTINKTVVMKNSLGNTEIVKKAARASYEKSLGASFRDLSAQEKSALKSRGGVMITDISNGALSKYTRIKKGFVITEVNETRIYSKADLQKVFNSESREFQMGGFYPNYEGNYFYSFRID